MGQKWSPKILGLHKKEKMGRGSPASLKKTSQSQQQSKSKTNLTKSTQKTASHSLSKQGGVAWKKGEGEEEGETA